jgi:hypothetical protein
MQIFKTYKAVNRIDRNYLSHLSNGKVYELFVLSHLLLRLKKRGFTLGFNGQTLHFKAGPGRIKQTDPHFTVRLGSAIWYIFVDIEFETLGSERLSQHDLSRMHELDIIITSTTSGNPSFRDIALGIECKAVENFGKHIIKEVLGIRRELSLLTAMQPSTLSCASTLNNVDVPASPPSELILAFIDPKGLRYVASPKRFGIELWYLKP